MSATDTPKQISQEAARQMLAALKLFNSIFPDPILVRGHALRKREVELLNLMAADTAAALDAVEGAV